MLRVRMDEILAASLPLLTSSSFSQPIVGVTTRPFQWEISKCYEQGTPLLIFIFQNSFTHTLLRDTWSKNNREQQLQPWRVKGNGAPRRKATNICSPVILVTLKMLSMSTVFPTWGLPLGSLTTWAYICNLPNGCLRPPRPPKFYSFRFLLFQCLLPVFVWKFWKTI